jgi:glycosyl transferase family 25
MVLIKNDVIQTKVFVISLRRATERREHISKQMQEQNIPFEFIDAVDGRTLTEEQNPEQVLFLVASFLLFHGADK